MALEMEAAGGSIWYFGLMGLIDLTVLLLQQPEDRGRRLAASLAVTAAAGGIPVCMDTSAVGRRLHAGKDAFDNSHAASTCSWTAPTNTASAFPALLSSSCASRSDVAPNALLHSLKHYKVLHEAVVIPATVTAADTPFVLPQKRR